MGEEHRKLRQKTKALDKAMLVWRNDRIIRKSTLTYLQSYPLVLSMRVGRRVHLFRALAIATNMSLYRTRCYHHQLGVVVVCDAGSNARLRSGF